MAVAVATVDTPDRRPVLVEALGVKRTDVSPAGKAASRLEYG
jgi:hypothetical protein